MRQDRLTVLFISATAPRSALGLETIVQIVNGRSDPVVMSTISQPDSSFLREDLPLKRAVEIVHHQKSAAQQKFAELRRLLIGNRPMPTSTAYIAGQLKTSSVPSRSTTCSTERVSMRLKRRMPCRQMPVRARIIRGPVGVAAAEASIDARNAKPRASPLRWPIPIRWHREISVLAAGVFLEGTLRPQTRPKRRTSASYRHRKISVQRRGTYQI